MATKGASGNTEEEHIRHTHQCPVDIVPSGRLWTWGKEGNCEPAAKVDVAVENLVRPGSRALCVTHSETSARISAEATVYALRSLCELAHLRRRAQIETCRARRPEMYH